MKAALLFAAGLVSGVLLSAAGYIYFYNQGERYISQAPLSLAFGQDPQAIVAVPVGTQFDHKAFFSEGFDQLCLVVNVESPARELFRVEVSDVTHPYWLQRPSDVRAP